MTFLLVDQVVFFALYSFDIYLVCSAIYLLKLSKNVISICVDSVFRVRTWYLRHVCHLNEGGVLKVIFGLSFKLQHDLMRDKMGLVNWFFTYE
ncbi:hypothetical protein HanIR_Chr15g0734241 [Helianthus annuus]|nr:hypothetical protein HanIR_Chr15g0734241 [Helianthus annuus]